MKIIFGFSQRVIACAETTLEDFYVIVHEMGHLQYYMAFSDQPTIYQVNAACKQTLKHVLSLSTIHLLAGWQCGNSREHRRCDFHGNDGSAASESFAATVRQAPVRWKIFKI